MALTGETAEGLCDALVVAGFDPSMSEAKPPTGNWHVIVDLDDGQLPADVEKIVRQKGMPSARIEHVTQDGLNSVYID